MTQIFVRANTVHGAIADLDRARAELASHLFALDTEMAEVLADWQSASGQALAARLKQWRTEMTAVMDRLDRLREALAEGEENYGRLQDSVKSI